MLAVSRCFFGGAWETAADNFEILAGDFVARGRWFFDPRFFLPLAIPQVSERRRALRYALNPILGVKRQPDPWKRIVSVGA